MGADPHDRAEGTLRRFSLSYPEVVEEFPWGHRAMKVRRKSFVFLARDDSHFSVSVKLPQSSVAALALPFTSPTEYGLGKSGWVTARFAREEKVPVELLGDWIDESYRAIAPKKLVASLEETSPVRRGRSRR